MSAKEKKGKKREQQKKRRKSMAGRVCFASALLLIVVLCSFGIARFVTGEKTAQEASGQAGMSTGTGAGSGTEAGGMSDAPQQNTADGQEGMEGNTDAADGGADGGNGNGGAPGDGNASGEVAYGDGTKRAGADWKKQHTRVRGIYVTGPKAGSAGMDDLIALVDATELNAMVIDVKDDGGNITYSMNLESVQESGACVRYIRDMDGLLTTLKEHHIYTIARIVCFKDDYLAKSRPDLALKTSDGTPVTDANGIMWVNPYSEEVWKYLTEIAQAALDIGFDEVQFDYVRFPVGSVADAAKYGVDMESYPKEQAITGFLGYVKTHLGEKAVVGADLFGTVIGSEVDKKKVGQNYAALGETVDVLCPMVYPSHYANGVFGLSVPDAYPYETVSGAMRNSIEALSEIKPENCAVVRPWLQSFNAIWVEGHITYGGEQIRQQIQAVYDAGYEEWILWNASNRYSADGLLTDEEAQNTTDISSATE